MKVIPPISTVAPWLIETSMVTSSTLTEPHTDETVWVSGTSYVIGDVRILTSTHRKYQRLVAGAGTTAPNLDTTNWLDIGPTNKWAMFDALRNSSSKFTTSLTVEVTPGKRVDSIALMGMIADSATVTVKVAGVTKYTKTTNLILRNTTTWSEYFYGEFSFQPSLVLFDLPPYTGAVITITLNKATGDSGLGAVVIGTSVDLGLIQYSPEIDSLNFSKVDRDAFGNATLVPRRSVPKTQQTLFCTKESVNSINQLKAKLDAVPAVWSGLDDKSTDGYFESLLMLGIWKRFSFNLTYPDHAVITLELEEI